MPSNENVPKFHEGLKIKFSHIHLYVDHLLDVDSYTKFQESINKYHEEFDVQSDNEFAQKPQVEINRARELWESMQNISGTVSSVYRSHGRDIVKQLIAGLGFRVTGCYPGSNNAEPTLNAMKTVLVTSSDPEGIQILVSSMNKELGHECYNAKYLHFDPENIYRFFNAHSNRQGIAVLAFEVEQGRLEEIYNRFSLLHPQLLVKNFKEKIKTYENEAKVFEVFAYYKGEKSDSSSDEGTILRFIEPIGCTNQPCKLPGIISVPAKFHESCNPVYFDHWVSNVISRTGFLETLKDTLDFIPKVDFNAGVVAAGEAQIESTVTGNTSVVSTSDKAVALKDQSQIYLPINNALTKVGHVHGFIKEIGQGVQHVASRVDDIVSFVQLANDRRKIFGEGFTFLSIPRSYYGVLTRDILTRGVQNDGVTVTKALISPECANAVLDTCVSAGIVQETYAVNLDLSLNDIREMLRSSIPSPHKIEFFQHEDDILETIMRSRYMNLYYLLRGHLSEESYVSIVRNQILVDVQGEDLLFQIFTSNILQRNSGEEAPFFEFIQRVCSESIGPDGCPKRVKAGCGGFGIRNFLTLFLSIEVTKAMLGASIAKENGDAAQYQYSQRMIEIFTDQLNESNPILTEITDAMTNEGMAADKIAALKIEGKEEEIRRLEVIIEQAALKKATANQKLMECNLKYQELMKSLRESRRNI